MLKKRLGLEAIERNNSFSGGVNVETYFKISPTLIIPEGCVKIGEGAFWGCGTLLEKVIIPKSIEEISGRAFWGCYETKIIIEKPVGKIRCVSAHAFNGCKYVSYAKEETWS